MAKGTKELKERISGVKNIRKITSAMELVATQKLKRLQTRAETARPFSEKIQEMVGRLASGVRPELSELLEGRDVRRASYLVVTGDKGLCGSYNTNVVKLVQGLARQRDGVERRFHVLGSKGQRVLAAKGETVHVAFDDTVEKLDFARARAIVNGLVREFVAGEVDEVHLVYTSFVSSVKQVPVVQQILPIDPASLTAGASAPQQNVDVILEPSVDELITRLLPKFLEVKGYSAILESLASEFSARRIAMKAATDAADDMIGALTRQYNRARQESITNEILEIVSGAEALA